MPQGLFELWVAEFKSALDESRWNDARAGEQQILGHFTEDQAGHERGHSAYRGAAQNVPQCFSELIITYRVWRYKINWPLNGIISNYVLDCCCYIVNAYPAHILFAVADGTAQPHLEREEHFLQSPAR